MVHTRLADYGCSSKKRMLHASESPPYTETTDNRDNITPHEYKAIGERQLRH